MSHGSFLIVIAEFIYGLLAYYTDYIRISYQVSIHGTEESC